MRPRLVRLTIVLGALSAFAPMSIDMYLPSLPTLAQVFEARPGRVQLTLAAFFVGLVCGQLVHGPLTDRYGRKRPLYAGIVLYVLASAGCALAPNLGSLIGLRFVQAFGGCAAIVVTRAAVRDLFDAQESARMFSMIMLVMGIAPIIAPLIGGYLLVLFGWQSIFGLLALFGILCLIGSATWLPETRHPSARSKVAMRKVAAGYGRLLVDREFIGYALAGGFAQAGMFAYIAGSPAVFIGVYGVAPQHFGWLFGANALGVIVASQLNRRLLKGQPASRVLFRANVANAALGVLLAGCAASGAGGFVGVLLPLFGYMASLGFISPNSSALALAHQGARAGTAAALLGTLQFGMAALASVLVGFLYDASATPMASVIGGCGLAALVAHRSLVPPEGGPAGSQRGRRQA
ncbi:MAG TPA: Bcr/CflA family multidrug efflux MFS transporter [Burkholderiales bacterium]|nr:Bcr/CflA family multidrug efflux MFS transporter [Burkholderiales bacterium]